MDDFISRADAIAVAKYSIDPIKDLEALPGPKVEKFGTSVLYTTDVIRYNPDYMDFTKSKMAHAIARYLLECNAIVFDDKIENYSDDKIENYSDDKIENYSGERCITATLLVIMPEQPKEGAK